MGNIHSSSPGFQRWLFPAFLLLYLAFSLATFRDYGITWDESDNYGNGLNYLHYYFEPWTCDRLNLGNHPAQEAATHNYLYPALLDLLNPSRSYGVFHLLNLLFGALLFAAVYRVLAEAYGKPSWAMAGCFFAALTPRLLGQLPNSPKDAPFAILYFLSLAGLYLVPRKVQGPWLQSFWIGTLIGVTSSLRVVGLTLLPILALYRLGGYFIGNDRREKPPLGPWLAGELVQWVLAFLYSQFWMLMLWPFLDGHYFHGLLEVFRDSKNYYWNGSILFMGRMIHPSDRLWDYLPVWIGVTTPLFILAFFLFSLFTFARRAEPQARSLYALLATAFGFNLLVDFILRPTIYNGLRHYLFLLPVLSAMAAMGFVEFLRGGFSKTLKVAGLALASANVVLVGVQMARLYPYVYVYFNETVGGLPGAYGKFETDYWGSSLKEAAQWLAAEAAREPGRTFRVRTSATSEQETCYFAPNMKGGNEMKNPDYWIALNVERDFHLTPELKDKVAHTVRREGVPLAYVLKMK